MIQINRHKQAKKYDDGLKEWSDHLADDLGVDLHQQAMWDIDIDGIDTTPISMFSTPLSINEFDDDSLDFDDLIGDIN